MMSKIYTTVNVIKGENHYSAFNRKNFLKRKKYVVHA